MSIMNSFVNDVFEQLAGEAARLAQYSSRTTLTSREVQTAVRLLLPGELAKHAVSEGTKAVTKYTSSKAFSVFIRDWFVQSQDKVYMETCKLQNHKSDFAASLRSHLTFPESNLEESLGNFLALPWWAEISSKQSICIPRQIRLLELTQSSEDEDTSQHNPFIVVLALVYLRDIHTFDVQY
ncbi:hypothetical protein CB1_002639003 [Camelus ferus]|nr:hypothetical protein CB1_002639003 [Camelus ferus]